MDTEKKTCDRNRFHIMGSEKIYVSFLTVFSYLFSNALCLIPSLYCFFKFYSAKTMKSVFVFIIAVLCSPCFVPYAIINTCSK